MKNIWKDFRLQGQGGPLLAVVLGLLLIINPDIGTGAVGIAVGALLIVVGVVFLVATIRGLPGVNIWELAVGTVAVVAGGIIIRNPQLLGKLLGYLVSALLILRGVRGLSECKRLAAMGEDHKISRIVALVTVAVGVLLLAVPMASSQILMRLVGTVLLVIGVINVGVETQFDRLIHQGRDDIVDAEQ